MEDEKVKGILQDKVKELENRADVKKYLSFKAALDVLLADYSIQTANNNGKEISSDVEYPTIKKMVASVFTDKKRFLHMRELVDIASVRFPQQDMKSIRLAVYQLKADGLIVPYAVNNSNKNVFWGSPEWQDEKGEIKPEYMYNEEQLKTKENIKI